MAQIDIDSVVDQLTLIGLISREQYREARAEAEDGSPEALIRVLMRKGWLTSWQLERLKKGDPSSFFFGNYRALFHLAEGTFARVYRGQHNENGSSAAIKVLRQRFVTMPEAVMRFHKEAEAGMRLRHPNIVQLDDQGQQDGRHYMIMEYVEGMNLREFLKLRIRIKDREAVPLMLGLARALEYSHDQGVTHRDLKATNVLISNSGVAKLVDFGLATIDNDQGRHHGILSQRTVDYSALERTCGSTKGDPRSDIYFLGCVFYHMLTGQVPLEDSESKDPLKKMLKRSFGVIRPISEHRYPPEEALATIIEKMMKMDLKARYQTMHAVVADLEEYQASIDPEVAELRAFGRKYDSQPEIGTEPEVEEAAEEEQPGGELLTEERGEIFEPHQNEVKAIDTKSVLCVEAQAEIQDALRKNLARMGYRVMLVADAERAAERYLESPTDAVIFDADGLGAETIDSLTDMHDKAKEDGRPFVALVVHGPRQAALKDKLPSCDQLIVLVKPIKMKQVQDAITELLPLG